MRRKDIKFARVSIRAQSERHTTRVHYNALFRRTTEHVHYTRIIYISKKRIVVPEVKIENYKSKSSHRNASSGAALTTHVRVHYKRAPVDFDLSGPLQVHGFGSSTLLRG